MRVDHRTQSVSFGADLQMSMEDEANDGPFLQHMPGDQLKNQLQMMARALSRAMEKLSMNDGEAVSYCHCILMYIIVLISNA